AELAAADPVQPLAQRLPRFRHQRDRSVPEPVQALHAAGAGRPRGDRPEPDGRDDRPDLPRGHRRPADPGLTMERVHGWSLALATVGVVVALDQLTKAWALAAVDPGDRVN